MIYLYDISNQNYPGKIIEIFDANQKDFVIANFLQSNPGAYAIAENPPIKTINGIECVDLESLSTNLESEIAPGWKAFRAVGKSPHWIRIGNAAGAAITTQFIILLWQVGDNPSQQIIEEISQIWEYLRAEPGVGITLEEREFFRDAAITAKLPQSFIDII